MDKFGRGVRVKSTYHIEITIEKDVGSLQRVI